MVFIFGASCGGKSTLAHELQKALGDGWAYVDGDDLVDQEGCSETSLPACLDRRVTELGSKVIIDTQIPWRDKKEGELYFLVLPPLEVLLARDDQRALCRPNRSPYARDFVAHTFKTLNEKPKDVFDRCFDSSRLSVAEEVEQVMRLVGSRF